MSADRRIIDNNALLARPWVQLLVGCLCVASVANLQYVWTLFAQPIQAAHHWGPEVQIAFTVFIVFESWLNPLEGYLIDLSEPRYAVMAGAALIAGAWYLNSLAGSLPVLYLGCALSGIGTGCVYGACVGNAIKWCPDRRGLAAGIIAAAFGAGTALTVWPISDMLQSQGYHNTFAIFGLIQGGFVAVMSALIVVAPRPTADAQSGTAQKQPDYTPAQVLRSPVFYVLYLLYVLVAVGGLTLAASVVAIAHVNHLDSRSLEVLGAPVGVVVLALSLNRICDGIARPIFGWLSDGIGRELAMACAFLLGGAALLLLETYSQSRLGFIVLTSVYFGVYGEIFSLFPATAADTFGPRYATTNIGMLYTAKGAGSLLVPVAAWIASHSGWGVVFNYAMYCNLVAAMLAVLLLVPLRERHFSNAARLSGKVFRGLTVPGQPTRKKRQPG